jgi:dUTP pyrophosphatase
MKRGGKSVYCETCNKEFYISPGRMKNKHHTCSKECLGALSSKLHSQKAKRNCVICNKELFYKQSASKNIKNPTCSRKCRGELNKTLYLGQNNPKALKLTPEEKVWWKKFSSYRYRAQENGWDFDLDYKFLMELYEKQKGLCFYSKLPMKLDGARDYDTLSLDRVDSTKGYTKDNVVLCLFCVNVFKSNYDLSALKKVFYSLSIENSFKIDTKAMKLYPDAQLPYKDSPSNAGYDIFVHRVEEFNDHIKVYSGIAIQPDLGYFYMMFPRSSTFKRGLILYNSCGIIDQNYSGELILVFYKTETFVSLPKKGDRLAQLVPQKQINVIWNEVDSLDKTDRGDSGFGSSGN